MKYCTHCGAEMDDAADFCVHCGKRVQGPGPSPDGGFPRFKYCTHCGAELKEGADVCLNCGRRVERPSCPPPPPRSRSNVNNVLATIAKVFMVLTCASCGVVAISCLILGLVFMSYGVTDDAGVLAGVIMYIYAACGLIPLAWCIPLTVHVFRATKAHAPISTAAKVCILIFVDLVAGILLLCMTEPSPRPMDDGNYPPPPPPQA